MMHHHSSKREEHTMMNEKMKNVVDETFAVEDQPCEAESIGHVEGKPREAEPIGDVDEQPCEAKPIGDVVWVSGEGTKKKNHFASFEYGDIRYNVEDAAMFNGEGKNCKCHVAIIKDITQLQVGNKNINLLVQWFYRPEEAKKKGGGIWKSLGDTRELYYSFHQDEVPAESTIHDCVVNFIPLEKQVPNRKHRGFIIQKVYDPLQKRLFKFTDNVYNKERREEIDLLIKKSMSRLRELPDVDKKVQLKKKRFMRKK